MSTFKLFFSHVESWENRHDYEMCKERANVNMKLKLAQHRGQRETLMKSVCAAVDQLVECGRKLHQCLLTSEIELINASLLDNLETLLSTLKVNMYFLNKSRKQTGSDWE